MNSIFHKSPALAMKISKDSLVSKKSYKGRRLYYIYIYNNNNKISGCG